MKTCSWKIEQLVEVAEMYYVRNLTQVDIAYRTHRSRQDVGRMLQYALREGVVKIYIPAAFERHSLRIRERELRERFTCLMDAVVVAGQPCSNEGVVFSLAEAAAHHFAALLTNESVLVVGKGQLVKVTANAFRLPHALPNLRIVPMVGFFREQYDVLDSNVIASDFQRATGGVYHWLPIPAVVRHKEQADIVRDIPLVDTTLQIMKEANMAITGIGSITASKYKTLNSIGVLNKQTESELKRTSQESWPVGEICGWLYDKEGHILPTPWSPIGFGLEAMRDLALSGRGQVVAVAGGDIKRYRAILGALKGKFINTLITDHITAQWLLEH